MAVASVKGGLTPQDVIEAVERMEPRQAEKVTRRLLQLQARRRVTTLPDRESELLSAVFREKRPGFQERFDLLSARRNSFTLTPEEHQELISLVYESEAFTTRRLEALGELAQLRQLTLPALMKQLGLKAPSVA
jgi:hypothetical protein